MRIPPSPPDFCWDTNLPGSLRARVSDLGSTVRIVKDRQSLAEDQRDTALRERVSLRAEKDALERERTALLVRLQVADHAALEARKKFERLEEVLKSSTRRPMTRE